MSSLLFVFSALTVRIFLASQHGVSLPSSASTALCLQTQVENTKISVFLLIASRIYQHDRQIIASDVLFRELFASKKMEMEIKFS